MSNSVMAAEVRAASTEEQPAKHAASVPVPVASVDLRVSVPRLTGFWVKDPAGGEGKGYFFYV